MGNDNTSTNESKLKMNRRQILGAVGTGGPLSVFGRTSLSRVSASQQSEDKISEPFSDREGSNFTITGNDMKTKAEAENDVDSVLQNHKTAELAHAITNETKREVAPSIPISISIETDQPELNSFNPAVTTVTVKDPTLSWEDATLQDAGAIFALTVDDGEGGRTPAVAFGFTIHSDSKDAYGRIKSKIFGDKRANGSGFKPGLVSTELTDGPINPQTSLHQSDKFPAHIESLIPEEFSESDASLQSEFKCEACITVIGVICFGVNELGRWGCLVQCLKVGAVPTAYAACSALCYALTSVYGRGFCAAGGPYWLCKGIDYC